MLMMYITGYITTLARGELSSENENWQRNFIDYFF